MKVLEAISDLARRVSTWGELPATETSGTAIEGGDTAAGGHIIYKLRHWPTLPAGARTVHVLQLLSLMSTRPVSRHWMLKHAKLTERQLDALLDRLAAQGALDEINPATFPREPRAAR